MLRILYHKFSDGKQAAATPIIRFSFATRNHHENFFFSTSIVTKINIIHGTVWITQYAWNASISDTIQTKHQQSREMVNARIDAKQTNSAK